MTGSIEDKIAALLNKHPLWSNRQIARHLGVSETTIRRHLKQMSIVRDYGHINRDNDGCEFKTVKVVERHTDPVDMAEKDREISRLRAESKSLVSEVLDMRKQLRAVQALSETDRSICITSEWPERKKERRSVVPVIVASDWHIEERVTKEITNGLNHYDIDTAVNSVQQFFTNATTLVNETKEHSNVDTVVLAILGDIVNGVLREEDLQNNNMTTINAASLAKQLLKEGIIRLQQNTGCHIKCVCAVGNHGRMTKKIFPSNQVNESIEYLIYKFLASELSDNENISFHIGEGYYCLEKIYKLRVRFHHGHRFRYQGGIGGLAVPVNRGISQMNRQEQADLDVFGHFHSFQRFTGAILNGSLVGYNGFAQMCGFPFEPPQQTFFCIDEKWGVTTVTPIFIER